MSAKNPFDASAPCALPIFYRTYSRLTEQGRENYQQVTDRTVEAIAELGQLHRGGNCPGARNAGKAAGAPLWSLAVDWGHRVASEARKTSVGLTTAPALVSLTGSRWL